MRVFSGSNWAIERVLLQWGPTQHVHHVEHVLLTPPPQHTAWQAELAQGADPMEALAAAERRVAAARRRMRRKVRLV